MNKRILSLLLFLLTATFAAKAHPLDISTVREVALKFVNANAKVPLHGVYELQWVSTRNISCGDAAFHVFNTPSGFVIVSADDCATPILGYSDEGQFDADDIPIQLQDYLQSFVEQMEYGILNHLEADEDIASQWALVQATGHLIDQRAATTVAPLLTDTWGQRCYYNNLCPEDSNGYCEHVVTGCVATCFAQIMRYWGYPSVGMGSHSYKPNNYPTQTVNFGATTYDWANMPNSLDASSSPDQVNAVATLMWHCGVAVEMSYGPRESNASSTYIASSFVNYFGYSDELSEVSRNDYSNAEWMAMMKSCLDLGRPIYYTGYEVNGSGGHAFVCDGYNSNNLLHFNWGWNGINNGYFANGALNPDNHSFNTGNSAIINIHAYCTPGTTYQVTVSSKPSNGGTVYGTGIYNCGADCTLTAVPADGYVFLSWAENGEIISTETTCSFTVMEDRSLVANFAEEGSVCSVIFELADSYGDGWNGNYLLVDYGEGMTERFTLDGGSSVSYTRTVVNGSLVALSWISGASIDECSFDIRFGNSVLIYHGGNLSPGFQHAFTLDCEAAYAPHVISVIANPEEGGAVAGAGTYEGGTVITVTATPNEGYLFAYWSEYGEPVSSEAAYSFVVTSDRNLEAFFSLPLTVTVATNTMAGGTVMGAGVYYYGAPVTLTATAYPGYVFRSWTKNGSVVSYLSSYVISLTQSAEYVANFEPVEGMVIGNATYSCPYLPSYYYYSLSEQIYTASEMGGAAAEITSVSFFNTGSLTRTRNLKVYMVHTNKASFANANDWIAVTNADLVFHGSVTPTAHNWVTIYFDTPFSYDGVSNVALIVDDNTNNYSSSNGRTFGTEGNQAICIYGYNTNYNPSQPSGYSGTLLTMKNQIVLGITPSTVTQTTELSEGWNWFSLSLELNPVEALQLLEEALESNADQIKARNGQYTEYDDEEEEWFGNLTMLTSENMYMIHITNACTIALQGPPARSAIHGLTIAPGWNWMGFPSAVEMSVEDAFANFEAEEDDELKGRGPYATFDGEEWFGTLQTLVPGQGYLYYSNSSVTKTLVFPTGAKHEIIP
ncbi:MAG: C10 family peptidase [Bacteroidales bacterium]|nr:C10 family peptidase [Bacteroidales bacterium]